MQWSNLRSILVTGAFYLVLCTWCFVLGALSLVLCGFDLSVEFFVLERIRTASEATGGPI
jgi:hypothetical protein